jgi:TolB protein
VAHAFALIAAALAFATLARAHEETQFSAEDENAEMRAAFALPAPGEPLAPLRITLLDAATGAALAGNVRVTNADGKPLLLELVEPRPKEPRPKAWHATAGPFEMQAPTGKLRIEAFQGLETELAVREVDVQPEVGAEVELSLVRFANAFERGLASGNTHLHLMAWPLDRVENYLRETTAADQVDFAWVSHLERFDTEVAYTTNELSRADLEALSTPHTRFGWGEELRHNFGEFSVGYGHVLLLDLQRLVEPVSIGPVLAGTPHDAPGLADGMAGARAQGAWTIWAHGANGYEDLPSWLLGRVDAQNLFDGAAPEDKLAGDHASYAAVFYPLLDVGLSVPFSTGTDWFIGDLARVYVALAGDRTTGAFLESLAAGRSFITNGPLLDFAVGDAGPGGVVKRDAPGVVPVRVRAIGRVDFGVLEVVVNGRVAARSDAFAVDGHYEAGIAQAIALDGPAWVAARIAPGEAMSELGKPLFAHTSAVTVEVGGERPFRSDVARKLVLEMDWNTRTIHAKAKFADAAQEREVTAPYREAMRALTARLSWRDWLHAWVVRLLRTLKGWIGL